MRLRAPEFGTTLPKRQIDVLLHVLDGANAGEVARALQISEHTAQGDIKALLVKTDSRNRAAMVAKVLDWRSARQVRKAHAVALLVLMSIVTWLPAFSHMPVFSA